MDSPSENPSESSTTKLRVPFLTEEQMDELISCIPKPPLSKCQAQLHTLASNVTVEIDEEPFEYIVAEEDVSSDEEDDSSSVDVIQNYWGSDRMMVRKYSTTVERRRVQETRGTNHGQTPSLTGGTSAGSGGSSQSAGTMQTKATSVESGRSNHQRQSSSDLVSVPERKGKGKEVSQRSSTDRHDNSTRRWHQKLRGRPSNYPHGHPEPSSQSKTLAGNKKTQAGPILLRGSFALLGTRGG